jgi:predicted RNA-binding protein with PIN domain
MADSVEAALHLLRAPGALVIVDGYNVAKLAWPDQTLAEQRRRLLDAIDEVVARHGTRVQIVFDAAAVDPAGRHTPRRLARVVFSPAGVVADDVIVDLVADQPTAQTVVVVSNDNDLRARVRKLGANVLGSEQLLAAARRAL